ncbi:MAG TPA: response regulator transcription factor [Hyphomonadaceae bacterium]|nr:response regulator transcription factor [Hyphomonadaceae bacterium]
MLRILIADDHEIVRHGVRDLVNSHEGWEIVGEAEDGQTAYELALATRPDVIVLDVSMSRLNGVTLARILRQELPSTNVLLFTMLEDQATVNAALGAGVRGYVLKSEGDVQLAAAIAALGARRPYFSPSITELVVDAAVNDRHKSCLENFTTRELEVAQLIAEGHSNKAIARALDLSVKTVESHRAAALRKARVHTAAELVRFAIKHNLIKP